MKALGHFDVDGQALGMTLRRASLFGGLDAARDSTGWRLQTAGRACLGLEIASARIGGALTLYPGALQLCPAQGRIMQQAGSRLSGRVNLSDIHVPFEGGQVSGALNLADTYVDWAAADGLRLDFKAGTLTLPSVIGERSLSLDAQTPELAIKFGQSTQISAVLSQTKLAGSLVPANVVIGETRFDGTLARGRFRATGQAQEVSITDTDPDPRYRPLLATFDGVFDGPNLTMSGPVFLASPNIQVADAKLDLNLLTLNGQGEVNSRDLQFQPYGLQPKTLSDRVRGLLTNGRGSIRATSAFAVNQGVVTGTGNVTITDFGFDSQRLGSADGINGSLYFDNLIALTTAPSQQVTIAQLDPGLPLENGELLFQLVGGTKVLIEKAEWPLAGGTLSLITPATWTISGGRELYRIDARNIELSQLVAVLSLPDIVAEGTVSGQFPIELSGGNTFIRDAHLAADSKGGTLSYTGAISEPAAESDERVRAAFDALRDFRFKVLEIGIDGNLVDDIVVSMRLLGRNPKVYGGADFDFRISIDSKLAQLIRSGRSAATTSWIADVVATEPEIDEGQETEDPFN